MKIKYENLIFDEEKDLLQCKICQKWFKNLGLHIKREHGTELNDYKDKFGIDRSIGLINNELREKRRKAAEKNKTYLNNLVIGGQKYRFASGENRVQKYKRSAQSRQRLIFMNKNKKHERTNSV